MKPFKIDFLCVGFNKSGTTTLENLLRYNPDIMLPKNKKEILFFDWYKTCENPVEIMQQKYYPNYQRGKCIGSVEPSYCKRAKEVYEYFGKDVKIVFMMRNPIKATFSLFKMRLRRIPSLEFANYYKTANNDLNKMFNLFIDRYIRKEHPKKVNRDYFYDEWINEYLKYFKKEQMKFIIMEDFFKDPNKYMQEITDFLQIDSLDYSQIEIPHSNTGDKISRNYLCARINNHLFEKNKHKKTQKSNNEVGFYRNIFNLIYKFTLKKTNKKIDENTKSELMQIYLPSIKRLEKITGINLKNKWY